jgi:hypothetical protein
MGKKKLALLIVLALLGCLAAVLAVGMPLPQQAQAMASVSGGVDSPTPFKAAQIYIRNVDKRILYMVYTNGGQFRAVSLFPGNYEVSVKAKGLESDVQKIALKSGDSPKLKLSLRAAKPNPSAPEELPYDTVYPPDPGRAVAERTCIVCHGENFIPTRPGAEAVWKARLDRMMGTFLPERPAASYAEGLLSYRNSALGFSRKDRDDLMAYLVKNFGPDAKPRAVRVEQEMPLDEARLGKAMYIEYYLPPDPPGAGVNAPEYKSLQAPFVGMRTGQDVRFDHDDNVWMALWDSGNIAKFDTHTNGWTIFTAPTYPGHVRRLNVDAQNNIWWGIYSAGKRPGKLAKLDQTTGKISEVTIPRQNTNPYDVMQDPEGSIWSADAGGSAAALWKFNPRDSTFVLYPKPQATADTPKIQVTKDGAVWYSPRGSQDAPAFGVLYPDMNKIPTLGAFYQNGPPGYPYKLAATPVRTGN